MNDKDLMLTRHWDFTHYYFAYQLVELRVLHRLSVQGLAAKSGVPARIIHAIEAGDLIKANALHTANLARVFDVAALVRFVPAFERPPKTFEAEHAETAASA